MLSAAIASQMTRRRTDRHAGSCRTGIGRSPRLVTFLGMASSSFDSRTMGCTPPKGLWAWFTGTALPAWHLQRLRKKGGLVRRSFRNAAVLRNDAATRKGPMRLNNGAVEATTEQGRGKRPKTDRRIRVGSHPRSAALREPGASPPLPFWNQTNAGVERPHACGRCHGEGCPVRMANNHSGRLDGSVAKKGSQAHHRSGPRSLSDCEGGPRTTSRLGARDLIKSAAKSTEEGLEQAVSKLVG